MRLAYVTHVLLAILLLLASAVTFGRSMVVYATEKPLQEYLSLLQTRPSFMLDEQPMSLQQSQRILSEIHIFNTAVMQSDQQVSLVLKSETANLKRTFLLTQTGRAATFVETYSLADIGDKRDDFYITQPLLAAGEYPVGLYTSVNNTRALASKPDQLSLLTAVSHPNWNTDWSILESLNFQHIHSVDSMDAALTLVAKQKADILLFAFQGSDDFSFTHLGDKVVPIVGISVFFPESRHFLVSKKHPDGEAIFTALESGLSTMRERGDIKKIYQRFGVMDLRVADWQVINRDKTLK